MRGARKIIEIDEEKCTGCGQCVLACAEGAIQIIDGKARLVSDVYCDGLGACIGECPEGALRIAEREAEEFDEAAVERRLATSGASEGAGTDGGPSPAAPLKPGQDDRGSFSCPGMAALTLDRSVAASEYREAGELRSELGHWPIKLQLLNPAAPFLRGADLVLLADCAAAALPDLHRKILRNQAVAMGCPKFDDLEAHIDRLAEILRVAGLSSLTVVHMEVPCCHGLAYLAEQAIKRSGATVAVKRMIVSRTGEVLAEEPVAR